MLLTQVLATAFVIVGCCITIYVIGVHCHCVVLGIDVDEDKIMGKVHTGVTVMFVIAFVTAITYPVELLVHLIPLRY